MGNPFDTLDRGSEGESPAARQFLADLGEVLLTEPGRRMMAAHIAACGALSYAQGERAEGRRDAGLDLLRACRAAAPDYAHLIVNHIADLTT